MPRIAGGKQEKSPAKRHFERLPGERFRTPFFGLSTPSGGKRSKPPSAQLWKPIATNDAALVPRIGFARISRSPEVSRRAEDKD